jgi:hypothetical protein
VPREDKSGCTSNQTRRAEHIEESYESRGVSGEEAERRAWATVKKAARRRNRRATGALESEER